MIVKCSVCMYRGPEPQTEPQIVYYHSREERSPRRFRSTYYRSGRPNIEPDKPADPTP